MRNTVQAMIELDREARAKTEAASEEARRIREKAAAESERLAEETRAAVETETTRICGEIRAASDASIAEIEMSAEEKCRRLDRIVGRSTEDWKKEILSRIFG